MEYDVVLGVKRLVLMRIFVDTLVLALHELRRILKNKSHENVLEPAQIEKRKQNK